MFSSLDTLSWWAEASPGGGEIEELVKSVHKGDLSQAAMQCRAPARALKYFETHLRQTDEHWPLPKREQFGQGVKVLPVSTVLLRFGRSGGSALIGRTNQ